jgi:hypothetical protein
MNNLFLSYNLSLIAKEKGFDEPCLAKYVNFTGHEPQCLIYKDSIFGENYLGKNTDEDINNSVAQDCTAPLYQQIIDWFREEYKKSIEIYSNHDGSFGYTINSWEKKPYEGYFRESGILNSIGNYYKTLDKAIEEAFKLI